MKIGRVAYTISKFGVEKVRIIEEISENIFKVKSISSVGTFGALKSNLFKTERGAQAGMVKVNKEKEEKIRKVTRTKEEIIEYMYSWMDPGLEREVVGELIKEVFGIDIN